MGNKVYLALGTNLGNKHQNIESAIKETSEFSTLKHRSSIYKTAPVGITDQEEFLNMVIEIETELKPSELMIRLEEIEHKMGRIRDLENGPRTIDLDILLYSGKSINQPHIKIPHPRLHKRSFVLDPLSEIAPDLIHPTLNKSIKTLQNELGKNRTACQRVN